MRPLSLERPKPLIPTLDLSQLSWLLAALGWAGVERAWVNAHTDTERIRDEAMAAGRRLGLQVRMSYEARAPLGTAGALRRLAAYLTEPFIVANADVATDAPVLEMAEAHRATNAAVTLLGIPVESGADMVVEDGRLVELVDRREASRAGHRYGGVGVFEPEVLGYVPDGPSGLYETVFRGLVRDRGRIGVLEWTGYWRDLGTPEAHLAANLDALSGALDGRGIPQFMLDGWQRWDAEAYVAEGAQVRRTVLREAVVGRRAKIAVGTRLERCVVWDGATVPRGDYRQAVITPRRVLQLEEPGEGAGE